MKGVKPLELDEAQLGELQRKLDKRELSDADCEQLKALIDLLRFLGTHYQAAKISMQRVLKMIFGNRTEKTDTQPESSVSGQVVTTANQYDRPMKTALPDD